MSDNGFEIKPATVPLSHQSEPASSAQPATEAAAKSSDGGQRRVIVLIALACTAAAVLWWVSNRDNDLQPANTAAEGRNAAASEADPASAIVGTGGGTSMAPFAQTQQALARTRAQGALAQFVEQQILLEETMAVGDWGQGLFDEAMATALSGDEYFVDDRFALAQAAYDESSALLAEIVSNGRQRVVAALARGQLAVDAQDSATATQAYNVALGIDPNNTAAQAGLARAAQLPAINALWLRARNHELAGQWSEAAARYEEILALDPATKGIDAALQQASVEVGGDTLRTTLSSGFTALEQRQFRKASQRFNEALALDPGNEVALGGLQQVNARTELASIGTLQRTAEQAVNAEDWSAAVDAYTAALKLDPNIQFAKAGMRTATEQRDAAQLLRRIIDEPNKLSSAELLEQGRSQLRAARSLQPQGPRLTKLIAASEALLAAYSKPVAVQLTSDNATEILVSTIGKLGTFKTRELSLRPGEYVLLGSRSGCRDVRQTVIVAPDMKPVDIRCREQLPR